MPPFSSAISLCAFCCTAESTHENKVGGCTVAVRNDYKNLVEEFGSASSRCAFLRLRDRRGRKLWIGSAHGPTETTDDNSKDALYDVHNELMSKIPSQQVVIVGIDARIEQQSDVLGKWYYPAKRTSDNGDPLIDLCERTGLIIASTFKRNHLRHQLTWQESTLSTPEEQRKLQDTVPQEEPRSSSSTENRHGRFERRRMQNGIPPTCVYSSCSTDQEEA
ncbi:hypothetical protein RB195_022386 [Necator americanus]